jgi:7-cyano-7-deazaguanine synthase in queuosine biosynthesis
MKRSSSERICPEYHFNFGPLGVQRTVPSLPGGEQNFYGQEYFADYGRIAGAFGHRISERHADWAELAVAIYIADRFSPRRDPRFRSDLVHRRRKIQLRIAVLDLSFWKSADTQKLLRDALWILTEDDWSFHFSQREIPLAPCAQEFLIQEPIGGSFRVALFSGGLDSFAGAASQLRTSALTHVFVSGVTHGRMEASQRQQMSLLRAANSADVRHLQVWYGLKEKKLRDTALEKSQRTRAFMHVTLGAVAALQAGANELYMYENGFGALNLPFDATQIGIETSRAANPVFHRAVEKFINAVSGKPFRIVNPFLFLTKGEALRHAHIDGFGSHLAETFSCDRFPDWREGRPQCGTCASCILRRLSLKAAGLAEFDSGSGYARDVKSSSFVPNDSAASVLAHYEEQALVLERALDQKNPWQALATDFPELYEVENALNPDGNNEQEIRGALLHLLRNQVAEWKAFDGRAALDRYLVAA